MADHPTEATSEKREIKYRFAFDHHDQGLRRDELFGIYERLRRHQIAWSDSNGGFWILSRYEDVRAALKDWETFSSAEGCFLPALGPRILGLESDPPDHATYRRLFLPVGGRIAVEAVTARLRELTERIVTEFVDAGGGDAVAAISERLPVEGIALMAGLSRDKAVRVREMTLDAFSRMGTHPDWLVPLATMLLEEAKARTGGSDDDFLTRLANATIDGRPISDDEIGNILVSTIIAGHETTMNASSHLMHELARNPELQERLRSEPELAPQVVEETLRHQAPVHLFFRTLTHDVTLHGETMRKGDKVAVLFASANRDPEQFERPEQFDPDRDFTGHLGFGWGIHRCVGAPLAQAELRMLALELTSRCKFEVSGEVETKPLAGGHHLGLRRLPLALET